MNRKEIAAKIDHTLLEPQATEEQIRELCREAREFGVAAVCVNGSRVGQAAGELVGSGIAVCTVVGFPLGAAASTGKAAEAVDAIARGAWEIDMVANIGLLKDGDDDAVFADISAVRHAIGDDGVLKVIIESAALTDDEIARACELAVEAGAEFVKTSTGFHPAGGASVEAVRLMRRTVGDRVQVKASGGIRTLADAEALLEAGADRLGLSGTVAVLGELEG